MKKTESKDDNKKHGGYADLKWVKKDNRRIQREADLARLERNRRLAERDAEYAKAFPHLVKRGTMAHEVQNDPFADLWKRYAG